MKTVAQIPEQLPSGLVGEPEFGVEPLVRHGDHQLGSVPLLLLTTALYTARLYRMPAAVQPDRL